MGIIMGFKFLSIMIQIRMYDTLANENISFRKSIVELGELYASNSKMEQKIKELEYSNKQLINQIEAADLQVYTKLKV